LLVGALEYLKNYSKTNRFELVVFGQAKPKSSSNFSFPVHYLGNLKNDTNLILSYNSADVMIVPSRQDNLPNTCLEAQACGVPIVAFNTGGLPDIIDHKKTGYLAKAFDTKDLANGINFVLDQIDPNKLRKNARQKALEKYSPKVIAEKFKSVYESVLK
jgi:glycosyltransferase involved in cell wall biosynthesis